MSGILSRDYTGKGARQNEAPKPYEHQSYPSVRYHRSHTAEKPVTKTVNNEDEHETLMADPDWAESPAVFEAAPAAEAVKPKAKK